MLRITSRMSFFGVSALEIKRVGAHTLSHAMRFVLPGQAFFEILTNDLRCALLSRKGVLKA